MKSLQIIQPNPSSRNYWKFQIKTAWKEATEAFLQVGNLLIQSESELDHGEFLEMIENDLPFSSRTSQMLMVIANDKRLSNTNHGSYLPPSWRTLYELTKLDDVSFKKSIRDGTIHPDMLRKEATRLRKRYEYELDEKERVPFVKKRNTKFKIYNEDCITGCRKRIDSNSIDLIINDPPFGIGEDDIGTRYSRCEDNVIDGYVEVPVSKYEEFSYEFMVEVERTLRKGGSAYIFSGYQNLRHILNSAVKVGLEERNHIIWKYDFGLDTTKRFVSCHYHLLYFIKPPLSKVTFNEFMSDGEPSEYNDREDVWSINREYKSPKTIKNQNELPPKLVEKIIKYSSNTDDKVMDMFLGGFTTARVGLELGREPLGFEVSNKSFNHLYPRFHLKR